MKKIMFYINTIHYGGAERVMVNLAKYFSEAGYDTSLATSFRDKWEYPLAQTVKRITLEEQEIKQSRLMRNLSRISKLRKICKEEKPDVLVSFMEEPNFRSILATRGLPIKTLVSVRNDPNKEYAGRLGAFVGKVLLPMADGCVFQTKEAQEWFPKKLQKKSRIIYNAVKEEFYHIERKPNRGEIVTCGRLTEQKNHAMLISAFAEVVKQYPYATLKIYGEGALREALQEQIDAAGLSGKAFLMGATNDVGKALQTADLFVLSSDYEGMPNALMEAMAAGVPCISTDCPCGGPRELLGDNARNKLVPCGAVQQLKMKLIEQLESSEAGKAEKKRAELFQPKRVNALWEKYLQEIIDR
ncbi:glycosyltransferase [Limosilactobacillus fermentum]|uniref:glycosyltransferase n=1 Tax=Limosilactobacillus fermentum TaxID=1613 RepID=UPI00209BC5D6|nr:glycosyltransferase [Limosilactobacillus fermentum]MCO8300256.1 glycosyltransferase [Limosilactobacillus fermentum]